MGRRDEGRGPAQPGVAAQLFRQDGGPRRRTGHRPLEYPFTNRRLDQVPRRGDLPTHEDVGWVQRVDDSRDADAQVMARRLEGGARRLVATPGAGDQILDRQWDALVRLSA